MGFRAFFILRNWEGTQFRRGNNLGERRNLKPDKLTNFRSIKIPENRQNQRFALRKRFLEAVADEHVDPATLQEAINSNFESNCPECGKEAKLELHKVTKTTGMILAFQISSDQKICCSSCARKFRLGAFLHTLFLGPWSPKSLIVTVFLAPYNLIRTLTVSTPKQPSKAFTRTIKADIGDRLISQG